MYIPTEQKTTTWVVTRAGTEQVIRASLHGKMVVDYYVVRFTWDLAGDQSHKAHLDSGQHTAPHILRLAAVIPIYSFS